MSTFIGDPVALLRTVVVGTLAYLALVAVLRMSGKRTLSQFNAFDFVVTVALGSTLATILLSRDVALLQGVLAFLVLVGMQFAITWTSQRSGRVREISKSAPTALIYRGQMLPDVMRRERVLASEVHAALRAHGLHSVGEADLVVLETDGTVTVVERLGDAPRTADAVAHLVPEDPSRNAR
jgi:uncharacterized membrane protein YcaP (DUF421 family)